MKLKTRKLCTDLHFKLWHVHFIFWHPTPLPILNWGQFLLKTVCLQICKIFGILLLGQAVIYTNLEWFIAQGLFTLDTEMYNFDFIHNFPTFCGIKLVSELYSNIHTSIFNKKTISVSDENEHFFWHFYFAIISLNFVPCEKILMLLHC